MRKIIYKVLHVIFCGLLLTSSVSDLISSVCCSQIRQSAFIDITQKQTNKQNHARQHTKKHELLRILISSTNIRLFGIILANFVRLFIQYLK